MTEAGTGSPGDELITQTLGTVQYILAGLKKFIQMPLL